MGLGGAGQGGRSSTTSAGYARTTGMALARAVVGAPGLPRPPHARLAAIPVLRVLVVSVFVLALTATPALAAPPETPELTVKPIFASIATFNGTLSPGAVVPAEGTYMFLYKASPTECVGGSETAPGLALGGAPPEVLPPEQVKGLTPATEYTVCLQTTNLSSETATSPPVTFKTATATKPEPPEATAVTERKATTATLNGVVNPLKEGEPGKYRFLYSQSASVCTGGSETAEEPAPGASPQPVSAAIAVLEPGKPYTFCVKAFNALGESTESTPKTFTTAVPPETPEASSLKVEPLGATTATLHGVLNANQEGEAGTFEFVYRQSPSECTGAGQQTVGALAAAGKGVPVQAEIKVLLPHKPYAFCLRARNEALEESAFSSPVTFTTLAAPAKIEEQFTSEVASTSATLHATVNPQGAETSYTFEYARSGGEFKPVLEPEGHGVIPEGVTGVAVSVHVQHGLAANTAYQFRLLVSNSAQKGATSEPVSFSTQTAGEFALPDNRQWEMVTPPDKHGVLFKPLTTGTGFFPEIAAIRASVAGTAIADIATAPSEAEPQGNANPSVSVLSTRGPSGWSSQVIAPPHPNAGPFNGEEEYQFFSDDLARAIVQPAGNFVPLSPEATESTAYLHTDYLNGNVSEHCEASYKGAASCFHPLVTAANDTATPFQPFGEATANGDCEVRLSCGPQFVAGNPDLSNVVVSSFVQLTSTHISTEEEIGEPQPNLYEFSGGRLQLLSIMPGGEQGARTFQIAGSQGAGTGQENVAARHAISDDGGRVLLETVTGFNTHPVGLYLRDVGEGETVRLDVPQGEGTAASVEPNYMTASGDGSRIFFVDSARLTTQSSPSGTDLYEYDLNAPMGSRLTDLTVDPNPGEPANAKVVLGASGDGAYLYFAAGGRLAPGAVNDGECFTQGCNLYVRHGGVTSLIAALSQEDKADWTPLGGLSVHELPVRVSPGGRWLAFTSKGDLTGYDTRDAVSGHADSEVYLYHAEPSPSGGLEPGTLACASCDPTGARPIGVELREGKGWAAANVPGWTEVEGHVARYQSRYLSDSGRLFFDAHDALVPKDVNGNSDVYQYEPEGVPAGEHACASANGSGSEVYKPAHRFTVESREGEEPAGCVALISSGTSSEESSFLEASETGGDVFFMTTAKLSTQDRDTAPDVYDGHECSASSPCLPPPAEQPPPCDTEASCRAAPTPQPDIFGAGGTATFSGPGNVSPSPAATTTKPKPLTNAQKLAKALKACRTKRNRKQRAACERQARRRYASKSKAKRATTKRRAKR
jgi:hypothetical protein